MSHYGKKNKSRTWEKNKKQAILVFHGGFRVKSVERFLLRLGDEVNMKLAIVTELTKIYEQWLRAVQLGLVSKEL